MSTKIITEFQIDGFNLRYNEYYSYVQYAKSNNKITVLDWGEIPFNSFSKEEQKKVLKELKSWIKILDKQPKVCYNKDTEKEKRGKQNENQRFPHR